MNKIFIMITGVVILFVVALAFALNKMIVSGCDEQGAMWLDRTSEQPGLRFRDKDGICILNHAGCGERLNTYVLEHRQLIAPKGCDRL